MATPEIEAWQVPMTNEELGRRIAFVAVRAHQWFAQIPLRVLPQEPSGFASALMVSNMLADLRHSLDQIEVDCGLSSRG